MKCTPKSALLNDLFSLLFNGTFPRFDLRFAVFQKTGAAVFSAALFIGIWYSPAVFWRWFLDASPYNAWYNFLKVDKLAHILAGNSYRYLSLKYYVGTLISPVATFLLLGEYYMAAAGNRKNKRTVPYRPGNASYKNRRHLPVLLFTNDH